MNRILSIPLVLALSLSSSFVIAAGTAKSDKHVTATFKTEDGKEIRCKVHKGDEGTLKALKKGDKVELVFDAVASNGSEDNLKLKD